jgi:glutathione S-transferase
MPSGGRRAGAGRKSPLGGKVERLLIASKIATALRTLGPQIEDPELPYEDIAASQSVLAQVPHRERNPKRLSKDTKQHLAWMDKELKRKRVRFAQRLTLSKIFAAVAAEETKRRGIRITKRQIRRCYEELLPRRRARPRGV